MPAATELVLFVGCLALLLLGAIRGDQDGPRLLTPLAVLTMLVAAVIALAHDKTRVLAFDGHFVLDSYAVFLKALKLGHVGIYPGQPERYFVLDFTLGEHFTDEVLVASADEDGVVDDEIVWES